MPEAVRAPALGIVPTLVHLHLGGVIVPMSQKGKLRFRGAVTCPSSRAGRLGRKAWLRAPPGPRCGEGFVFPAPVSICPRGRACSKAACWGENGRCLGDPTVTKQQCRPESRLTEITDKDCMTQCQKTSFWLGFFGLFVIVTRNKVIPHSRVPRLNKRLPAPEAGVPQVVLDADRHLPPRYHGGSHGR